MEAQVKLSFKLVAIFFILTKLYAREVIVISYHPLAHELAKKVLNITTRKLGIAPDLITTYQVENTCPVRKSAIIQICINYRGEISYPIYRKTILRKTLRKILGSKNDF